MRLNFIAVVIIAFAYAATAFAADVNAGKAIFREKCSLCHTAERDDNGGAQGPTLYRVFGRRAGVIPKFSYTKALAESGLTWDVDTLDRFLTAPATVVPGTAMMAAVPQKSERENLIAYFKAVKENGPVASTPRVSADVLNGILVDLRCNVPKDKVENAAKTFRSMPDLKPLMDEARCKMPPLPKAEADWKKDKPGRLHHITAASLPVPFATPSVNNPAKSVEQPPDGRLFVPPGFHISIFATGLGGLRNMRVAPNGDIFVAETGAGSVKVLRPSGDGLTADAITTFAQGLTGPFGMAFYPEGDEPKWLYVAENNRVVRYAYKVGDQVASGAPEIVVPQLAPYSEHGHSTRDIAFSRDGKRMFVSVGSGSNIAEQIPKKTPAEIAAWEAEHGLGAAWQQETNRADVLVFEVGSAQPGKTFATGIRNCVGLTIEPKTGNLWCTVNERDLLGDDLVPDYSTRVKEGGYYGWPWYYIGNHEEPRLKGARPDLAGKAIVPDVLYAAHSAALTLTFYTAQSGRAAFPKEYLGDGFAALHGSWNAGFRTGSKIVRVRMKDGIPTGEYEDFMVGFIVDDSHVWGRPVGTVIAADGALLVSDDSSGRIYRIAYGQ